MPRNLSPISFYDPNKGNLAAADMRAQLYNGDGTVHGALIATGFSPKRNPDNSIIPNKFVWQGTVPDDFLNGSVDFLTSTGRRLGGVDIEGEFDLIVPDLPAIDPAEELTWMFERVHPAPGTSIPAFSCERHLVRAKAVRPDGSALSALELAAFGLEIAFYKGATAPIWYTMQPDQTRNALAATIASNSFYFSRQVGPGANPALALPAGSYSVAVRVAASPHVGRTLGLLTIAPPNP